MLSPSEAKSLCQQIANEYSCCDVADALHVLKVPSAGCLSDIQPLPTPGREQTAPRKIAPLSTVLFVPKSHQPDPSRLAGDDDPTIPQKSNLPTNRHWTDVAAPGSIVLLQQPAGQTCALLGDIVGTRLKARGLAGVVVDGRTRDVVGCGELTSTGEFGVWTKGLGAAGTSLEAKPWAVDVPVRVGGVFVRPGDFIVVDEAERGLVVIPREKLEEVVEILPGLKKADDGVLEEVRKGVGLREAFQLHPGHYTHLA